jgi:hypothetical protein
MLQTHAEEKRVRVALFLLEFRGKGSRRGHSCC